jgi:hypothetical protein
MKAACRSKAEPVLERQDQEGGRGEGKAFLFPIRFTVR